jgi:hypothetical protein
MWTSVDTRHMLLERQRVHCAFVRFDEMSIVREAESSSLNFCALSIHFVDSNTSKVWYKWRGLQQCDKPCQQARAIRTTGTRTFGCIIALIEAYANRKSYLDLFTCETVSLSSKAWLLSADLYMGKWQKGVGIYG